MAPSVRANQPCGQVSKAIVGMGLCGHSHDLWATVQEQQQRKVIMCVCAKCWCWGETQARGLANPCRPGEGSAVCRRRTKRALLEGWHPNPREGRKRVAKPWKLSATVAGSDEWEGLGGRRTVSGPPPGTEAQTGARSRSSSEGSAWSEPKRGG